MMETSIPVDVTTKGQLHKGHEAAAHPLEHAPQLKHLTQQPVQWFGDGIMGTILLNTVEREQKKEMPKFAVKKKKLLGHARYNGMMGMILLGTTEAEPKTTKNLFDAKISYYLDTSGD